VVPGDLDDRASLAKAMEGVSGVFHVQNWWETERAGDQQGMNVAEAAKKTLAFRHFVL